MKMRTRSVVLATVLILGAVQVRAQLVEDYRFRGKVVDTAGKPLDRVRFTFREVTSGQLMTFDTDAQGAFDRRMIAHGVYEVAIEKAGYVSQHLSYDWSASAATTIDKQA